MEKIGFSKFAELYPQHCVLAGASGTHAVCVCTILYCLKENLMNISINQTAKFMINDNKVTAVLVKTYKLKKYL